MEPKTIQLSRLQNMEHYQFAGHVLTMCEEANIEKLKPVIEAPLPILKYGADCVVKHGPHLFFVIRRICIS
ncbi:hypothetical protein JHU38_09085 [Prevotella sp. A2931]|uniref:Uncharacterized protein n=1 Tax=Prevotella illustrans TaxID=2800387 RepID=A0ABS3M724_9BACT|nr:MULTISPECIES: hypothetical protein [Prevotella]MBO1363921.1 hypothetical protein [Prevotella illustrans]PTL25444.1 hypothetical protein C3V39_12420 [Prevotella sp. oral taxon 820]